MRPEKEAMAVALREQLDGSEYALMVDYRGLSVEQFADLRARLHGVRARCHVVRNAILEKVAGQAGRPLGSEALVGPTALVTGSGDVTAAAAVLRDFARANEKPAMKGGLLGTAILSAADVVAMANLPPRLMLLGQLVGTVAAPMSRLAGVLGRKVSSLLYVLKAVEEKKARISA
jgi:large subunit ribosomal protein L10